MAGQECRTWLFRTGSIPHSGQENAMVRFRGQQSVHPPVRLWLWDLIPGLRLWEEGLVAGDERNEVCNAEKCQKNTGVS